MQKNDERYKNFKVSLGYFQSLQRRFPQLSIRKIQAFDRLRATEVNKPIIDSYFGILENALQAVNEIIGQNITPHQIFNVDEVGITLQNSTGFIVNRRGAKSSYLVDDGDKTHLSIIACVSANGLALDPYFLIKGKRNRPNFEKNLILSGFSDSEYSMTPKAYITNESFLDWTKYFLKYLQKESIKGALLLCDSHTCHTLNFDALTLLNQNNVICLSFPSHSSHILQALDVSVFHSFKAHLRDTQIEFRRDIKKTLNYDDLPFIVKGAWDQSFTTSNIKSGMLLYNSSLNYLRFS